MSGIRYANRPWPQPRASRLKAATSASAPTPTANGQVLQEVAVGPLVPGSAEPPWRESASGRLPAVIGGRQSVVTDLALPHWDGDRFVLDPVAPGFTPEEVIAVKEMDIDVAPNVRTME